MRSPIFTPTVILGFFTLLYGSMYVAGSYEIKDLRNHIEYLEEYIEDNGLPTPARIR